MITDDYETHLDRIRKLQAENERLRADANEARAALAIVREIAAAVPLKDTLAATRTGATLVEYVKQAMQKAAAKPPVPNS